MKEEPTEFTVKLTKIDATSKVKLIKEIKNLVPGLNLVQVSSHREFKLKTPVVSVVAKRLLIFDFSI